MRYLSVCSGIEAASAAWEPLGWEPVAFAEIDPAPCAVLNHRYPHVKNWGDFTTIGEEHGPIDVLVGGTPCQSFSVAGLRAGLGDDRGNLALEFLRLAGRLRPRWLVWENVPGVFSSLSHDAPDSRPPDIDLDGDDGPGDGETVLVEDEYECDEVHAFGCFLAGLSELGYGFAYRVLDAQFAGVPQRRRRVFVVGHSGDRGGLVGPPSREDVARFSRISAAVLFERHSLSGNPPPGREAEPVSAGSLAASPGSRNGQPDEGDNDGLVIPRGYGGNNSAGPISVATTLSAHGGSHGQLDFESETFVAHTLRADGFDASEDGTGRGTPLVVDPVAYQCHGSDIGRMGTLRSGHGDVQRGVPFIVNAAESCAVQSHARRSETARCIDSIGSFANAQGGTVVAQPIPIDMRQASRGGTMTNNRPEGSSGGAPGTGIGEPGDPAPSLSLSRPPAILASAVRRLTPVECERLQGFPDDHTLVPFRGRPTADGNRYKAIGNSMAVPCMIWIGKRLQMVEDIINGKNA